MFLKPSLILGSVLLLVLTGCSSPAGGSAGGRDPGALTLDLRGLPGVTKVSYEFIYEALTIVSEIAPSGPTVLIDHPALAGKTWQTTIEVFTLGANDSFQNSYRYSAALFFDGHEVRLPSVGSAAWSAHVVTEVALPPAPGSSLAATAMPLDKIRVYWPADARTEFAVELRVPLGWRFRGVLDRSFWSVEGDPASDLQNLAFTVDEQGARKDAADEGSVSFVTKGNELVVRITVPEIDGVLWDQARWADSFLMFMNGFQWQYGYGWDHNLQLLFKWEVSSEFSRPILGLQSP